MKYSLSISNFLEEISSLFHSIVFLYFFALTTEEGFLSLLAILWNSVFKWVCLSFSPLLFTSLLFTAICKASSDRHFAFLHFFFWGSSCSLSPLNLLLFFSTFIPLFACPSVLFPLQLIFNVYKSSLSTSI